MRSRSNEEDMDCAQQLAEDHPKAVDAVYFNGANQDGWYFVAATARRHEGLVQTLLYIRIPGIGLLELPSLPDTSVKGDKEMVYSAGGLVIEPVEPMKQWRLTFAGSLRLLERSSHDEGDSPKIVAVNFQLDWKAITRYFDFDTDLHPNALCDGIAREPWSRTFFDNLQIAHQTHYEQFGEIRGVVNIDGHKPVQLNVTGVRDHSYGNLRDWSDLHRYAIQYVHLTDGTSICVGNICMPRTMSRLVIGYVFHTDGKMDAVDSNDVYLEKLGEDGNDPIDCTLNFSAGGVKYQLEIHVVDRPIFYMGKEWESRIHERMCTYRLNGYRTGYGISEWCYRNVAGKLDDYKGRLWNKQ
jgi:hypothetical protein